MRYLNVRLLLIVTVTSLLIAVGVYSLHKHQIRRHAEMYLEEAKQARDDGRTAEAVGYVRKYVSLRPTDVDGLSVYGGLLAELRSFDGAYFVYGRILGLDEGNDDVRRKMVDVSIALRRYSEAKEHIRKLQPEGAAPDADLLAALGRCHRALGEYREAAGAFAIAVQNRCEPEIYQEFAILLRTQLNEPDRAQHWIEQVVIDHPDDYRSYLIHGTWNLREERNVGGASPADRAVSVWEDGLRAVELAKDEPEVIWFLVRAAKDKDQIAEAKKQVLEAIAEHPASAAMYGAAAELDMQSGDRQAAIEMLERGLLQSPGHQELLWNLASLQLEEGKFAEVKQALESLTTAEYAPGPLSYLRARILMSDQQWLSASRELEGIRRDVVESSGFRKQINYWLGICYQNLGNHDQAATAFRRAISVDPLWGPARAGLAATHFSRGDVTAALDQYWQLAYLPDAPLTAVVNLARLRILVNLRRDSADQDWPAVEQLLETIELNAPEAVDVPILRAEVAFLRGEKEAAEQLLEAAIAVHPDDERLRLAQIALMTRLQDWTRVTELLQQAKGRHGESVPLRLAEANFLVARDGSDLSKQLDELAQVPEDWSDEDGVSLAAGLARVHLGIGNDEAAEAHARVVANAESGNLLVRLLLFDLAFRRKNDSALQDILAEIHEIEGKGPLWRYGKAVQLTLRAEQENNEDLLVEVKRHLNEAALLRPSWARIPWLLGETLERQGNEGAAMERYSEAIQLGERRPGAIAQATALLFRNERFFEADQMLRRLQEQEQQSPFSPELMRVAAEVSLELKDVDRALEFAARAASTANTPDNHLWLGHVHEVHGDYADAEAELRKAISLQSDALPYWVALVQFHVRRGDVAQAEAIIEEARDAVDPERSAFLAAQCFESLGQATIAEKEYHQAIERAPNDPAILRSLAAFYLRAGAFDQAESWLLKLLADEAATEPDDQTWARRNLALGLGYRRGQQSLLDALDLLEDNLARDPDSLPDKRAKARILAAQPTKRDRQSAVRLFEELRRAGWKPPEEDQFLLAKLYIADNNDWNRGSRLLRGLLSQQGSNNPQIIATYAQLLLQRGENAEAELWLNKLHKLAPDVRAAEELEFQLLFNRKRYDDLFATLDRRLPPGPAESHDAPAEVGVEARRRGAGWFDIYARALKAQGELEHAERFFQAAEAAYEKLIVDEPAEASQLASFFARQGDVDHALEVLGRSPSMIPATDLAATGRLLLAQAGEVQQSQLQAILDSALQREPRPVSLVLMLADFHSWRQELDASQRLYDEVLQTDPDNLMALNNQAMLIALAQQRTDDAMRLVTSAINTAGPIGLLLDTRGVIRLVAGDAQAALADFDAAVQEKETVDLSFHRAQALLALRRITEAEAAFHRAVELGLARGRLHPVERPAFDQLVQRFGSAAARPAAL